ncbi:hypothetical protein JCM11251_000856 [Rhodosporidiobolus azoricus]
MSTRSSDPAPSDTPSPYPPVQPTGSLLLAYQLPPPPAPSPSPSDTPPRPYAVLLIGGGAVAASRLYHLLCAGAPKIVLIAPKEGVCDETQWWIQQAEKGAGWGGQVKTRIEWRDRVYAGEQDLETEQGEADYAMVLTAIDEVGLSSSICLACRRLKIPVNVADVPPECDFYFGSVLRRGALSVMVSTNGKGPRVAARVRRRLEKALPETAGEAIENVGQLRMGLRKITAGEGKKKEIIERRMEWMSRVSDKWSLAQLGEMDERMREEVLEGWDRSEAKGYWDVNTSAYGGLGYLLSAVQNFWWRISPATVEGDPDKAWAERPAWVAAGGFVAGLAVGVGAAAAVVARRR